MKKYDKQRLFEVMEKLDPTFASQPYEYNVHNNSTKMKEFGFLDVNKDGFSLRFHMVGNNEYAGSIRFDKNATVDERVFSTILNIIYQIIDETQSPLISFDSDQHNKNFCRYAISNFKYKDKYKVSEYSNNGGLEVKMIGYEINPNRYGW